MGSSHEGHPLLGKVAVVTGSGRNIGRAIALALAADGADVLIHVGHDLAAGERVAEEVRQLGRRAIVGAADLRDASAVEDLINQTRHQLGPVQIVVNNAAARPEAPFEELTYESWRDVLGVVLDGAFVCTHAAIGDMRKATWGRVVNITGLSAQKGASHRAHVVAAKSGLIGFTKALALEYASDGITVNAVSPGMIDTARDPGAGAKAPRHHQGAVIPVGRLGTPTEVASAVRYLVSPEAAYITGQTLSVNGGTYL